MAELAYLVLRCTDIELSRAWYEGLGFQLVPEKHGSGPAHYSMELSGVVLEIYPLKSASTAGARVGIRVAAPVAASKKALEVGGELVSSSAEGVVIRDLDGHTFELMALG